MNPFWVDLIKDFFVGVTGGIVSAVIIFLFQGIYKKQFIPWFEERLYDELEISGRWLARWTAENGATGIDEVELIRKGHNISGNIRCIDGYDRTAQYGYKGTFKNNVITATYYDRDKTFLARGTFTLKLIKSGHCFQGMSTFYSEETDLIEFVKYNWYRERRESPATIAVNELSAEKVKEEMANLEATNATNI